MEKKVSDKFTHTVEKISNIGDVLLNDENHLDWEIDKIVLSSKSNPEDRIECFWEKKDGKWVKICRRI